MPPSFYLSAMWFAIFMCSASLVYATPQNTVSSVTIDTGNPDDLSYNNLNTFINVCEGQPTASVSCGSLASEEHSKEIEVRVIYWLTTRLPFYKQTVQYDVLQYESSVTTTATRTVFNNATGLDMQSYTSLIPSAQVSPSGPYSISEVDAVYGTTEKIGSETLTFPTPYALIFNRVHVHQMGMCDNGTEFSASAWFDQPAPIPLPTTLNYLDMPAEVNFTIPGFNEAFHSLYPALSYCGFSAFSGQPSPKVVVETSVSTDIQTYSAMLQTTPTSGTNGQSLSPLGTTANAAALSSAADQLGSLASYIICGLGASCTSSISSSRSSILDASTDSHGRTYFIATPTESTAPTVATLGRDQIPIYTVRSGGAIIVPLWTTLEPGASAATVGDAVMSVGTDGAVVVDGNIVAKGEQKQTSVGGEVIGRSAWSGSRGPGGTGGGGGSVGQRSLSRSGVRLGSTYTFDWPDANNLLSTWSKLS